ncbi:MAG: serine hydrolase, partial [Thermodesulfobacteriaceae bacterium]|nr:serine hydrolase [Thermodesulfobacteriaceae bacterium]
VALDGLTGQILYAKNPHIKIPPASTVKLLTAMIVLDRLPLHQKVRISKKAEDTPSTAPALFEGEIYTVDDLLHLMLIKSSNQAAVALAEAVAGSEEKFSELMNQKVKTLGFRDSQFITASGLPAPGQYTTAYELALLLYEALKYPHIKEIINLPVKIITSQQGRTIVVKNTNKLLFEEDLRDEIIGGKTGYTRLSKHCLVNVAQVKDRLIITSLLGAPYRDSLWEDTKKLLKFTELVLERKISPVIINTAVNLSLPVQFKPLSYYRESKRTTKKSSLHSKSQKLASKTHLAKTRPTNKRIALANKNQTKRNNSKKIQSKKYYTARSKAQKNS